MKKAIILTLALVCLLSLCACGEKEEQPRPTLTPTAAPVAEAAPVIAETEAPAVTAAPAVPEKSLFDLAKALEGESVEELIAAVGEPVSREDYAPSCLGDGEDGLWHYADFDVYTYREGESESVYAVMGK